MNPAGDRLCCWRCWGCWRPRECGGPSPHSVARADRQYEPDGKGRRYRRANRRPAAGAGTSWLYCVPYEDCPVMAGLTSHAMTGEAMDARGDARLPAHEARGSGAGTRRAADRSITRRSAKPIGLVAGREGEPAHPCSPAAQRPRARPRIACRSMPLFGGSARCRKRPQSAYPEVGRWPDARMESFVKRLHRQNSFR